MNFLGILNFPAPWLPWVLLAFSTILGASPVVDLIGIFVGHVYYYLEDIVPRMPGRFRGKKLIFTPRILKYLMDGPQVHHSSTIHRNSSRPCPPAVSSHSLLSWLEIAGGRVGAWHVSQHPSPSLSR